MIIMDVRRVYVFEAFGDSLQMAVPGIVTDSKIGDVCGGFEFLNALDRGNLIWNVLDHDAHPSKCADLCDRRIGVIKSHGMERVTGITQMNHHIGWRHMLGEFEHALELVQGRFAVPPLRR